MDDSPGTTLQEGSPTLHIDEASGRVTLSLQRPQRVPQASSAPAWRIARRSAKRPNG